MRKLLIIFCSFYCLCAAAQRQELSTKDLRDAKYKIRPITSSKRCASCPATKPGYDITTDTLIKLISADLKVSKIVPAYQLPPMQYSPYDTLAIAEFDTGLPRYDGKIVWERAYFQLFGSEQNYEIRKDIDELLDVKGWTATSFSDGFPISIYTERSSLWRRDFDWKVNQDNDMALFAFKPYSNSNSRFNEKFYLKIRFTKK